MKFSDLLKIMKEYNIPEDVHIVSDSGWECDPTEVEKIVYFKHNNLMVLNQQFYWYVDDFEEIKEDQLRYLGKFSRLRKYPDTDYTKYITDDNLDAIIIDLKNNITYWLSNEEIEKLAKEEYGYSEAYQKELEKYSEDEVLSSDGRNKINN